jgi:nitrate/nitrite transporter NarK
VSKRNIIYLISVIFFGAFVALSGWIIGVVIDGFGQHLKATLDTAVHGSPFLSSLQRAQLMRLD